MAKPLPYHVVKGARDLIARPDGWTDLVVARDKLGRSCEWDDPNATQFCAAGAIMRSAYNLSKDKHFATKLRPGGVGFWRTAGWLCLNEGWFGLNGGREAVIASMDRYLAKR